MLPPGHSLIADFASRIEAEAAASFLESEGIAAVVLADDAGGILPELVPGASLAVADEDAALARELLARTEARSRIHAVPDEEE